MKKIIIILTLLISLFGLFSLNVNANENAINKLDELEICEFKLFEGIGSEAYDYYSQGNNIQGLVNYFPNSQCYIRYESRSDFDKIADNIDAVQQIDREINNIKTSYEASEELTGGSEIKEVNASDYITAVDSAKSIRNGAKFFEPIDEILNTRVDMTGHYDKDYFDIQTFVRAVIAPNKTPTQLRELGLNLDNFILFNIGIFLLSIFIKSLLSYRDIVEYSKSIPLIQAFLRVIKENLKPLIYFFFIIDIVMIIIMFFLSSVPVIVNKVVIADGASINCSTDVFSNGMPKDGYCLSMKPDDYCYNNASQTCSFRYALMNDKLKDLRYANVNDFRDLSSDNIFNGDAIKNTIKKVSINANKTFSLFSTSWLSIIIFIWLALMLFWLGKSVFIFYIFPVFKPLASITNKGAVIFILTLAGIMVEFAVSYLLISISFRGIIALFNTDLNIKSILFIFFYMGIPVVLQGLVISLFVSFASKRAPNLIDSGKQNLYSQYQHRKSQVMKVTGIFKRKKIK